MTYKYNGYVHYPALTGKQEVSGLWFPHHWFDEQKRQQLILQYWQINAKVFRFTKGDLLLYQQPVFEFCHHFDGWPLRYQGKLLCSALLESGELKQFPSSDVCLIMGGGVETLHFKDANQLEPAQWIGLSSHDFIEPYEIKLKVLTPEIECIAAPATIRQILGDQIPVSSSEQKEVVKNLLTRKQKSGNSKTLNTRESNGNSNGFFSGIHFLLIFYSFLIFGSLIWIQQISNNTEWIDKNIELIFVILCCLIAFCLMIHLSIKQWFYDLVANSQSQEGVSSMEQSGHTSESTIPARSSHFLSPQRWRTWLTNFVMMTKFSKLLGRKQAEYINKMVMLFESGNIEEALRHAIPLGGHGESSEQSFGVPKARDLLTLTNQQGGGGSIFLDEHLNTYLQNTYRKTFEKLDRAGRVDEAVFVLAELLQSRTEALDYLEKHERFDQAAELALSWDMHAEMIVRLYCLSGKWREAIMVAKRDHAFAGSVLQLEGKYADLAKKLRIEWAEALVLQGAYLDAVEVIWPIATERERAKKWLLLAETSSKILAASALVKRVILLPDTLDSYADYLSNICYEPEFHQERLHIAKEVLRLKEHSKPEVNKLSWLIAGFINQLLADQINDLGLLSQNEVRALIKLSQDQLFQADLPTSNLSRLFNKNRSLANVERLKEWGAPKSGHHAVYDAVEIYSGSYLLALGESGVVLVGTFGQKQKHFNVPASQIVLSHNKQIALFLMPRDQVWRVSKLDIVKMHIEDLGVLHIDSYGKVFDGIHWTIALSDRIMVVDVYNKFKIVWQVSDLPGSICGLSISQNQEQWLFRTRNEKLELWKYWLPQRRLSSRDVFEDTDDTRASLMLNPDCGLVRFWTHHEVGGGLALNVFEHGVKKTINLLCSSEPLFIQPENDWIVIGQKDDSEDVEWLFLIYKPKMAIRAKVSWPSGINYSVRRNDEDWFIFDQEGRFTHIDMSNCNVSQFSF